MENILLGFTQVFTPLTFLALFCGVCIGLIVGSLPGLNDSITLAVIIPITFGMQPQVAMALMVGVYCSACYGGSIPAILLKIPGTASSVVTSIDGYEMTQKGKGGLALGISTLSSVFGGIMSALILMFLAPFLASYALKFGPPEYFALAVLGLSTVAGTTSKGLLKNLITCALGLIIALVGMDPQTGFPRFYFGNSYLYEGVPFVPLLIGLFGISSIMELAETIKVKSLSNVKVPKCGKILPDRKMIKRLLPTCIVSGIIGNIIGIIPGAGMIMAIYFAYNHAKSKNKDKDKEFGTGVEEGVAAPEAANNAVVASSMVPLLSLGLPGNSTSALFLGALMIQGLRPGPSLFNDYPEIAYLIIVSFLVANLIMGPLGIALSKFMATTIFKIPREVLSGIIVALCITGAFAVSNSIFNIKVALLFGILGYIFNKLKLPQSPFILALVLGSMMEKNLYKSLVLSKGSISIFFTRPLSAVILACSLCFLLVPIYSFLKNKKDVSINSDRVLESA